MEKEIAAKIVVGAICIVVAIAAYRTKDLDTVKDAFIYRFSYAMLMVRGVLFIAVDILGLWSRAG